MTEGTDERETKRAATERAMLDAAERLFSDLGFENVSVRNIAQAAGVSHALVHRYLGSKEEIYRAVMRRNENAMREAAGATTDLDQALSLMFREGLGRHRSYLRLIAHSALKGIPYETGIVRFRATERLVELAEKRAGGVSGTRPEAVDPRVVVAAIVALYVGWASMGSWVVQATGLAEVDEDTIDAELERIILHLADAIAPGGDEG